MKENFDSLKEEMSFEFQPISEKVENEEKKLVEVKFDYIKEEEDFLNIIEDFYFVESINKLTAKESYDIQQRISSIKKISNAHGHLLRLAFFYYTELEKCINDMSNLNLELYRFDLPFFDSIYSMFKYLIVKSSDNDYVLERLYTLNILYTIIINYSEGDFCYNPLNSPYGMFYWKSIRVNNRGIYDNCILKSPQLFSYIKNWFNESIKRYENILMKFISLKDLDDFGNNCGITYFGDKFQKALKKTWGSKFIKKEFNCYATVTCAEKRYISINGVKDDEIDPNSNKAATIEVLKNLLAEESEIIEYVSISDDTKYYFKESNCCYISYKEFKLEKLHKKYNRMFSCCERKLLSKIRENSTGNNLRAELLITKKPCQICKREIDIDGRIEIKSSSTEDSLSEEKLRKMDICAKKIFMKNKNLI